MDKLRSPLHVFFPVAVNRLFPEISFVGRSAKRLWEPALFQVFLFWLIGWCALGALPASDQLLQQLQPDGLVTDRANVLGPQKQPLETLLTELKQKTTAELAVVTLTSLEGGEINDFANRLFERWKIGKQGKDNGVLFLVAVQDRKVRLEVGYGLEPILPDAKVGRILDEHVIPFFRANRMADGVVQGASVVAQTIAASAGVALTGQIPAPAQPVRGGRRPGGWPILWIVIFVIIMILSSRRRRYSRGGWNWGGGGFGGWSGGSGSWSGGGGGFGGFGGGSSGGGGASRGW